MRHRKAGKKLNRSTAHRKALYRNMLRSLLTHEKIKTTASKAKEISRQMDRLVTLAKADDLHSRRLAYKTLSNHQLVKKLFDEVGPRFTGVEGGYTRVVKFAKPRVGDAAPMALVEFTRSSEGSGVKETDSDTAVNE
ncbi:MAG: 50S ribosomal protein L17 [Desulfonatronovibrionaceae bacterium]